MGKPRTQHESGTAVAEKTRTKTPKQYKVILLNDDYTTMEFVVYIMEAVFMKSPAEAIQIMLQVHTDGYFQGATDNNSGMAAALELARHYAKLPRAQRPRTLVFLLFPDHHHGEVAHRMKGGIDQTYDWKKVALKLTIEDRKSTRLNSSH